jgi:hypothetical protein
MGLFTRECHRTNPKTQPPNRFFLPVPLSMESKVQTTGHAAAPSPARLLPCERSSSACQGLIYQNPSHGTAVAFCAQHVRTTCMRLLWAGARRPEGELVDFVVESPNHKAGELLHRRITGIRCPGLARDDNNRPKLPDAALGVDATDADRRTPFVWTHAFVCLGISI